MLLLGLKVLGGSEEVLQARWNTWKHSLSLNYSYRMVLTTVATVLLFYFFYLKVAK